MFLKLLFGFVLVAHIDAIFLITLPPAEVTKFHNKLAAKDPHVLLSPNDVTLSSVNLLDLESNYHRRPIAIKDAKNLVDLAQSLNLTILVKALEETGLDNVIDHEGKYTLFAPTNEAFKNIPEWAGKIPLKELLKFHVARGLIYSKDITNDMLVRSILAKRDIRLNLYKNDSLITANGSPITSDVDFEAHNGVLHIIDRVMVSIYDREGSIVKELARCPVFKTLSKLIGVAGLCEALAAKGPVTLFAPTNDALAKLPADVVSHLVENPALLKQILLYHVAVGTWYSAGLEDGAKLPTAAGGKLEISLSGGAVMINGNSTVVGPDATATNGVIHAIDTIIMPPTVAKKIEK